MTLLVVLEKVIFMKVNIVQTKGVVNMKLGKFGEKLMESNMQMPEIRLITEIFDEYGKRPCYFPEYTIHGKEHVEKVISHAEKLIHKDTWELLDGNCIRALILSICLHDLGMFIDEGGFETLQKNNAWEKMFSAFIQELKYANNNDLNRIYGALIEGDKDFDTLRERRRNMYDRSNVYTVGEFLRKYHHELASYIAINGFPRKNGHKQLIVAGSERFKKTVGCIAEAHRGKIEEMIKKLGTNRNQGYIFDDIPVGFLMAIIWVADEIDDKCDYRAPIESEKNREILSKYSQQQWVDNRCVFNPTFNGDLLRVYVSAKPDNTSQYLRVDGHCKKVQNSITNSWAILSEYYGEKYKLSIFGVYSDIYDYKDEFEKHFLTEDASLKVSSDITRLLIKPLYDGDVRYGVRELLSNALDACRNRETLDSGYIGNAKITCKLDSLNKIFTIEDNGTGMTGDVIVNYFMNVGRSLRNNEHHTQRGYENDSNGDYPKLGRFGIGILSAYLLGNEMTVTTRHWQDTSGYGYCFTYNIDIGGCPDVMRIKCKEGTSISVKMASSPKAEMLFSDYERYKYALPHYPFDYPLCLYHFDNENALRFNSNIHYYISKPNFLISKEYSNFKLGIGSLLDLHRYFDDEVGFMVPILSDITRLHSFPKSHIKYDINKQFSYISIQQVLYNGMVVNLPSYIDNEIFSYSNNYPLYINIIDSNFSTPLNLIKVDILDCEALYEIYELYYFFLIMYPLTLSAEKASTLMKKYPYSDVVKRDEDTLSMEERFEYTKEAPSLRLPVKKTKAYMFEYDIEYYWDIKKSSHFSIIYDVIKKWLEVSPEYEQSYKIPYSIDERKRKFTKAFSELQKYFNRCNGAI